MKHSQWFPDGALDTHFETEEYADALWLGMVNIALGTYDVDRPQYGTSAALEGYRDALDDSDDYPDPVDLEETLIP